MVYVLYIYLEVAVDTLSVYLKRILIHKTKSVKNFFMLIFIKRASICT